MFRIEKRDLSKEGVCFYDLYEDLGYIDELTNRRKETLIGTFNSEEDAELHIKELTRFKEDLHENNQKRVG